MNSVCPMLYIDLDFKATIEKQHINKAELFYKSLNNSAKMAVYLSSSQEGWLGSQPSIQKTNCVCRFYIKLKCKSLATGFHDYHFH